MLFRSDTWPVVLEQTLTVGPNMRIEFRREGAEGHVDVELPRAEFVELRDRLGLAPGARVHLRPRRITRFAAAALGAAALAPLAVQAQEAPNPVVASGGVDIDQRLLDHYAG